MKRKFLLFFLIALAFPFAFAHAASLSVVASNVAPEIGQPIRVDVALDTQGDDANAIQGEVVFPAAQFQVRNITDGSSPFSFWIEAPTETVSGTVSFSGIVPDGFEGAASSVVTVWLLPTASGPATISLNDMELLRNDGQGSPIAITTTPATILVSALTASTTPGRPISFITPDSFTPIISSDPNIYGGKYFLVFSTTDKGSGIAYYEVLEAPTAGGAQNLSSAWVVATSPYLLEDQTLSSNIYVRAVDHDGNFIVVELPAEHSAAARAAKSASDALIIVLCLLLLFIIFFAWLLLK